MSESLSQVCNKNFTILNEDKSLQLYSIYDKKLNKFIPPFFASCQEDAIRQVSSIVNYTNSLICRFPEDYSLYFVGYFDEKSGMLISQPDDNFIKVTECVSLKTEEGTRWSELVAKVEQDKTQIASIVQDYHRCADLIDEFEKRVSSLKVFYDDLSELYSNGRNFSKVSNPDPLHISKKSILDKLFSKK
ncbi:nonstructural protein [Dipodfec virus UOA04_Rod_760]|nr:nonstructural protein [Dipodfec virus UOA04_Rod_760]